MESTLDDKVIHLRFADCTLDAAKQNEGLQNRPPQQQEEANLGPPIHH